MRRTSSYDPADRVGPPRQTHAMPAHSTALCVHRGGDSECRCPNERVSFGSRERRSKRFDPSVTCTDVSHRTQRPLVIRYSRSTA